jgi:nicotinamidase-related amidase
MRASILITFVVLSAAIASGGEPETRTYDNRLKLIADTEPLLADHPEFVQPVREVRRFEAAPLLDQKDATLDVRAWRWSYNARGIIEIPNRIRGDQTAVVVVHPWGIDDGQGWRTPQPAGCAFQCTLEKNQLLRKHVQKVVNPLLKRLRPEVSLVMYSLPGKEDPIRKKLYRSVRSQPTAADRKAGSKELHAKLTSFEYKGEPLPKQIEVSKEFAVVDYFRQFRGIDAHGRYNGEGFWKLPIPVIKDIEVADDDVVAYDGEGYELLRDFLKENGVRHVILAGYNTDMCVCSTTAGYENLRRDFNVFLVGDATIATFPANSKPAYATNAAVSYAALDLLITQGSWIKPITE